MTATAKMVLALAAATEPTEVKHRPGPGNRQLSYVDARFVMDRLDSTVGPESWQDRYSETGLGVHCEIGINIEGEWVWKGDIGSQSDIEPAKGAYSDAFKRAAVKWGIARDLYDGEQSTSHTGNGRSSRPSVTAGRGDSPPTPRPAPLRAVEDAPAEPDWLREMDGGGDPDECPVHHKPFKFNSRGGYCPTKVGDGWCQERPKAAASR